MSLPLVDLALVLLAALIFILGSGVWIAVAIGIVGYIAMSDLTYMGMMVRTRTYSVVPLLLIALIYLLIVMLMTWGLKKLERRLSKSDHR